MNLDLSTVAYLKNVLNSNNNSFMFSSPNTLFMVKRASSFKIYQNVKNMFVQVQKVRQHIVIYKQISEIELKMFCT